MKKKAFVFVALIIILFSGCGEEKYYPETGKVISVSGDVVTVETCTGNLFEFYGSEDWMIGDCVSMILNSCGTPTVEDDEILKVKYSGRFFPLFLCGNPYIIHICIIYDLSGRNGILYQAVYYTVWKH